MRHSPILLLCFLACACSTPPRGGARSDPPGAIVSVVSGSVVLRVEVRAPAEDGAPALAFSDEKRLTAGERYRLDLKPGQRAVLSFDGAEAARTVLEIRKRGRVTRFVLEHDDLIGKRITISDD